PHDHHDGDVHRASDDRRCPLSGHAPVRLVVVRRGEPKAVRHDQRLPRVLVRQADPVRFQLGAAASSARRAAAPDLGYRPRAGTRRARVSCLGDAARLGDADNRDLDDRPHGPELTTMRTPLNRVRGLGPAHSGTGHFWLQRLTAMANVPLTIYFLFLFATLSGRSHAAVTATLGEPFVAIMLLAAIFSIVVH